MRLRSWTALALSMALVMSLFPPPARASLPQRATGMPIFSSQALVSSSVFARQPFRLNLFPESRKWLSDHFRELRQDSQQPNRPILRWAGPLWAIPFLSAFTLQGSDFRVILIAASFFIGLNLTHARQLHTRLKNSRSRIGKSLGELKEDLDIETKRLRQSPNGWAHIEQIARFYEQSGEVPHQDHPDLAPDFPHNYAQVFALYNTIQEGHRQKNISLFIALFTFFLLTVIPLQSTAAITFYVPKLASASLTFFALTTALPHPWFTNKRLWFWTFLFIGTLIAASFWTPLWEPLFQNLILSSVGPGLGLPIAFGSVSAMSHVFAPPSPPDTGESISPEHLTQIIEELTDNLRNGLEEPDDTSRRLYDSLSPSSQKLFLDNWRNVGDELNHQRNLPGALRTLMLAAYHTLERVHSAPLEPRAGLRLHNAFQQAIDQLSRQTTDLRSPLSIPDLFITVSLSAFTRNESHLRYMVQNLQRLPDPMRFEVVAYYALHQAIHLTQGLGKNDMVDLSLLVNALEFLYHEEMRGITANQQIKVDLVVGAATASLLPLIREIPEISLRFRPQGHPQAQSELRRMMQVLDQWDFERRKERLVAMQTSDQTAPVPFRAIRPFYGHGLLAYSLPVSPAEFLWSYGDLNMARSTIAPFSVSEADRARLNEEYDRLVEAFKQLSPARTSRGNTPAQPRWQTLSLLILGTFSLSGFSGGSLPTNLSLIFSYAIAVGLAIGWKKFLPLHIGTAHKILPLKGIYQSA